MVVGFAVGEKEQSIGKPRTIVSRDGAKWSSSDPPLGGQAPRKNGSVVKYGGN